MRVHILLFGIFVASFPARGLADPPKIPPPAMVEHWARFDRKVNLTSQRRSPSLGYWSDWGEPVWVVAYASEKETLTSFVLALYEAATFSAMKSESLEKLRKVFQQFSKETPGVENLIGGIEKLADGRELYTFTAGFGPGGSTKIACAPSADGRYDVVLVRQDDGQGDRPVEQRLSNPAEAKARLQDMFIKFDTYIRNP